MRVFFFACRNSLLYIHEDMLETNQKTQAVVDQCLLVPKPLTLPSAVEP